MNALRITILTLCLSLGACASGTYRTGALHIDSSYQPGMRGYVASMGGMPVEILGDPFPDDRAAFRRLVISGLEKSAMGPPMPFMDASEANPRTRMRTVVLANPVRPTNLMNICDRDYAGETAAVRDRLELLAAFCRGGKMVTGITGSVSDLKGFQDDRIARLIASIGVQLYPSRSPEFGDDDDDRLLIPQMQ